VPRCQEILEDGLFEERMIEICSGNIEAVPERFIPHFIL